MPKRPGQLGLLVVAVAIALIIVRCGGGGGEDGASTEDAGPTTTTPADGYLAGDGPVEAMATFQAALGEGLKIREVGFYPEYVIIEAQDPAKPQNIDRYTLRAGAIGDPEPVHLSASDIVEVQVFRVREVDWAVVSDVAARAAQRLRIEDGRPTYAYVEKNAEKELRLNVSVDSPRRSGSVEADLDGNILEATLY